MENKDLFALMVGALVAVVYALINQNNSKK